MRYVIFSSNFTNLDSSSTVALLLLRTYALYLKDFRLLVFLILLSVTLFGIVVVSWSNPKFRLMQTHSELRSGPFLEHHQSLRNSVMGATQNYLGRRMWFPLNVQETLELKFCAAGFVWFDTFLQKNFWHFQSGAAVAWEALVIFDTIIFLLVLFKAFKERGPFIGPTPLTRLIFRDGMYLSVLLGSFSFSPGAIYFVWVSSRILVDGRWTPFQGHGDCERYHCDHVLCRGRSMSGTTAGKLKPFCCRFSRCVAISNLSSALSSDCVTI